MDTLLNLSTPAVLLSSAFGLTALGGAFTVCARLRQERERFRIDNAFFQSTFQASAVGMTVANREGHYLRVNRAMCDFVGYSETELLQRSYQDITCLEDFPDRERVRSQLLDGSLPRLQREVRYVRKDGRSVWALVVASRVLDQDGDVAYWVSQVLDIDSRKHAELALIESRRQLRELSKHQESLLENERKRIAREIHDELGQRLTALKMEISLLRLGFGHNPALFRIADEMRTLADGTMDAVRQIASNLRPAVLDLGLVPAIEWLAEQLYKRASIQVHLDLGTEDIPMDDNHVTVAFRAIQESLTNIARHARAQEVRIRLRGSRAGLDLQIQDDGIGFDPARLDSQQGFGIMGMRERVTALGGTLALHSQPGSGTRITIAIPLQEPT